MFCGYILFFTTSSAFESENLLESFNTKLTPTPREFSSDCGIAIYFEVHTKEELTNLQNILNNAKIEYELKIIT